MARENQAQQINIPTWLADLRAVYETNPTASGALALIDVLVLQHDQVVANLAGLSDDAFIEHGLTSGGFDADLSALRARLLWMATRYGQIQASGNTGEVELAEVYNFVARPILDGRYPQEMLDGLNPEDRRGIVQLPDGGGGKGFGDAVASATLWNQAAVAGNFDARLGKGWAIESMREIISNAAKQVAASAPGENPTLRDVTADALQDIADAPGALLRAVGGNALVWGLGIGAGLVVAYMLLRD